MAIHQTHQFNTTPEKLYQTLVNSAQFSEATGAEAVIDAQEGGAFSCFGGQITGRQIELVPNEKIVQAWRVGAWDAGVYSIVAFGISGSGNSTTLTLDHTGFPEAAQQHLEGGWQKMYWEPLKAQLSADGMTAGN